MTFGALIQIWEQHYERESHSSMERRSNFWSESKVIDENQSIKWNKEQIIQHNKGVEEKFRNECIDIREERRELLYKTFEYFRDEAGYDKLTQNQFNIAWAKAYSEGHSEGIHRILDEVEEYLDFFFEMLDADPV